MVDSSVVLAAAALAAAASLGGVVVQSWATGRAVKAEDRRAQIARTVLRRSERQQTYEAILDLLSDWGWSPDSGAPYDVVEDFNKPFNRAALRIRIYGSPATIAAIDKIQDGFQRQNAAVDDEEQADAASLIWAGIGDLVQAARDDVGPREEDELPEVPYRRDQGPPA